MEIKEYVKMRKEELQKEVSSLGRTPNMAIVVVGDNPASEAYVRGKMKDCAEIGVNGDLRRLPETATEKELLDLIKELNEDPNVDGLLVQLPVPKQISEHAIHMAIDPRKDIDGFVPMTEFDCCTPKGII
ncbi:MAG: bifunctional 5,10-methylene-tetrahydrofolate dehydrogenase/5,10-methylene-tetrahydrofolate cyclohydrolase, partial [Bacilli bacterium]|nr:bifunctional 5,10-methylene-tetrahydrofolate dehydrogenase/5,10-methylene-tetrahydrofolate cyclohydrolase [Bacilli bacterium]